MATLNYAFKELSCKIVYYGCGLCGKTTNLIYIHKTVPPKFRGELVSLATEQDRTLFFDFLPLDLGEVKGFKTKFQLYTVPGQVYYNATRKLVLRGVDGLVFVVDSQRDRLQENVDSLENLKQNLAEYGYHLQTGPDDHDGIPWLLQYNKRDMPQVSTLDELNKALNGANVPVYEAVAVTGVGVKDVLKGISSLVIKKLNAESTPGQGLGAEKEPAKPAAAPARAAAPAAAPAGAPDDEYSAMTEEELNQEVDGKGRPAKPAQKPAAPAPAPAKAAQPSAAKQPAAPPPAPAKPATPPPAPAPAPAKASKPAPQKQSAPPPAPTTQQLNVVKQNKANWRGLGLGSANLTLTNLVGGESDQFQLTGKVSFLGILGSTWSRKLRYKGKESKQEDGKGADFLKFTSDDGAQPDLQVWVKDDFEKSLYITYVGSYGEVQIVPPGKQPLA